LHARAARRQHEPQDSWTQDEFVHTVLALGASRVSADRARFVMLFASLVKEVRRTGLASASCCACKNTAGLRADDPGHCVEAQVDMEALVAPFVSALLKLGADKRAANASVRLKVARLLVCPENQGAVAWHPAVGGVVMVYADALRAAWFAARDDVTACLRDLATDDEPSIVEIATGNKTDRRARRVYVAMKETESAKARIPPVKTHQMLRARREELAHTG
jgi:hypothetical protein